MKNGSYILIIDDDPNFGKTLADILTSRGHEVKSFAAGITALQQAEREAPALAIIDLKLLDIPGLEIIAKMRGISPSTECIVLTGFATRDSAIEAINLGAYSYLEKPIDLDNFLLTIVRALEKRRSAFELQQLKDFNEGIVQTISEGIVLIDSDGIITFANPAVSELLGYTPGEIVGKEWVSFVSDPWRSIMGEVAKMTHSVGGHYEIQLIRADGSPIDVLVSESPHDIETQSGGSMAIFLDITKRKKTEEALLNSRQQLRHFAHYLQSAREKERAHIAREIHDEFGQSLSALKLDLAWLSRRIRENEDELHPKITSMTELVDRTIKMVRRIASDLRPGLLDDLGLLAALEWQSREFASRTGIHVDLTLPDDDLNIGKDLDITIFRIFQETLTNVARHADADWVTAEFSISPRSVTLVVQDNGRGIREDEISNSTSLGLLGMRERAFAQGGEISIHGNQDKGTTITLQMPLPNGSSSS